ncbi:MAG: type II toxin-antitoxin system RelE/ParE family toxin [Salinarimonas sp.]
MPKAHDVVLLASAERDLVDLRGYIRAESGATAALRFVRQVRRYCRGLATFPERGARRDDIAPGLRVTGFRRRVAIVFTVQGRTVSIVRGLYRGRDGDALPAGQRD